MIWLLSSCQDDDRHEQRHIPALQAACSRRAALQARGCCRGPVAAARRRALQEAQQALAQLRLTVGGG